MANWRKLLARPRTTGMLDITHDMQPAANHVSGRLLLRRTESEVTMIFEDLVVDRDGTTTLYRLPSGFTPFWTTRQPWLIPNSTLDGGSVNITPAGYVVGYSLQSGSAMTARVVFDCAQAWPSTYPGVEVEL